jgi:hypothetical protein
MCAAVDVVLSIPFGDDDAHEVSSYDADACAHFPTAWCAGGCDSGVGTEVRQCKLNP